MSNFYILEACERQNRSESSWGDYRLRPFMSPKPLATFPRPPHRKRTSYRQIIKISVY